MPDIIVKAKTKKQEKAIKNFLESLDVEYMTEVQEEAALYNAMLKGKKTKTLSAKEQDAFLKKLKQAK
jgi:predicted Ser/Thr protein kinase